LEAKGMVNLEVPTVEISPKESKFVVKNGFTVTYEYGWAKPVNTESSEADIAIIASHNCNASIQSWNGSISFYSEELEVKLE
jgi:hypothetical protein